MQLNQTDLGELVPSPDFLIMNGKDVDLEAEIAEVMADIAQAVKQTMRVGKLIRLKKNKPFTLNSYTVRQHLAHAKEHSSAALGGLDPMNSDAETGLPNVYHLVTRAGFALRRHRIDEEKAAHMSGQINEAVEE